MHSRCTPILGSFTRASSVMLHFLTLVPLPPNCSLTFSVHSISGALSSYSHMFPQNLANFLISSIRPTCSISLFIFLKRFIWSLSKLKLPITYLILSVSFWNLTFLYLSLSNKLFLYYCFPDRVVGSAPPINFLSLSNSSLKLAVAFLFLSCSVHFIAGSC